MQVAPISRYFRLYESIAGPAINLKIRAVRANILIRVPIWDAGAPKESA